MKKLLFLSIFMSSVLSSPEWPSNGTSSVYENGHEAFAGKKIVQISGESAKNLYETLPNVDILSPFYANINYRRSENIECAEEVKEKAKYTCIFYVAKKTGNILNREYFD